MNGFIMGATPGNGKLRITKMIAVQTGTYQEQHVRPFNINANKEAVQRLDIATRGGNNLGVQAVQEVASDIIVPQAMVEGVVGIKEGWRSRRFRFMMNVNETHPFIQGTVTQRIFFGYSDHCDASAQYLPDDMRVYFNSETIVVSAIQNTVNGPQRVVNIVGTNQIVSPVDMMGGSNGMFARATSHLCRPEDMFNIQQTQTVAQRLQDSGMFDGVIARSIDHRTMVGEGGAFKYSTRRDTSPVRYLSNSLNAYQHSVKELAMAEHGDDMFGQPSQEVLFGEAASHCRNASIHSNTFLAMLKDHAGYMERGYVTWGELRAIFPELNQYGQGGVTNFAMDNGRSIQKVSMAEDSAGWAGADYTSIGASLLAQAIPSIMMDTYLRRISFAVTNGMGPNNYAVEIHPTGTKSIIDDLDTATITKHIMEFERRLGTDILNNISRGNQIPFKISMASDLAGDSVIDISVGGEPVARFVAPTFSDSLFSPVITRNDQLPTNMSGDLTWLVQQVIPNQMQNQAINMVGYNHPVAPAATMSANTNQGVMNNVADLGLL
ncbi:hypothetical protein AVT69_gp064 [Pseudomonas phage PhiPA3]|uniref:Uncharacterized protein 063 n=1 Tax=Pseudomonas phage PhiPA3 TaxID=998086 RepID=F8SJU5_BPPA3|nr:hypothetical protein AVT69_gp064 [Pseudomonas phage PhiPA3]AEH03490.1 hypothetical protein [Pseudomonas phage PhiPA3]